MTVDIGPIIAVLFLLLVFFAVVAWFRDRKPLVCVCGGSTEHYCGMGASIDKCTRCGRLVP